MKFIENVKEDDYEKYMEEMKEHTHFYNHLNG